MEIYCLHLQMSNGQSWFHMVSSAPAEDPLQVPLCHSRHLKRRQITYWWHLPVVTFSGEKDREGLNVPFCFCRWTPAETDKPTGNQHGDHISGSRRKDAGAWDSYGRRRGGCERAVGAIDGKCAGRQNQSISKHRMVHSKGRKKNKGKQTVNGIKDILEFLGPYERWQINNIYDSLAYLSNFHYSWDL